MGCLRSYIPVVSSFLGHWVVYGFYNELQVIRVIIYAIYFHLRVHSVRRTGWWFQQWSKVSLHSGGDDWQLQLSNQNKQVTWRRSVQINTHTLGQWSMSVWGRNIYTRFTSIRSYGIWAQVNIEIEPLQKYHGKNLLRWNSVKRYKNAIGGNMCYRGVLSIARMSTE